LDDADNSYVTLADLTPLWFFLAGLPAAFILDRAIRDLSDVPVGEDEATSARSTLPWQVGPWPARVRVGIALPAPFLLALAGWRFDLPQAIVVSLLLLALLACTGTDLIRYRVPNVITYPGIAIALLASLALPDGDIVSAIAAAAGGGGIFLVMAIVTRGGIGLGDVKLAMLIGAALGLSGSYQALVFGVLAGGVGILLLLLAGIVSRKQAVPYAPFLALAAVAVVLTQGPVFAPL
jgi:prepilin signal peptidase PulO-like enzyme (type II secretory pathway)